MAESKSPRSEDVRKYLSRLGHKGAKARAAKLTPEERKEIARKAAQARWAKRKKK